MSIDVESIAYQTSSANHLSRSVISGGKSLRGIRAHRKTTTYQPPPKYKKRETRGEKKVSKDTTPGTPCIQPGSSSSLPTVFVANICLSSIVYVFSYSLFSIVACRVIFVFDSQLASDSTTSLHNLLWLLLDAMIHKHTGVCEKCTCGELM